MKLVFQIVIFSFLMTGIACTPRTKTAADTGDVAIADSIAVEEETEPVFTRDMVVIRKELSYDKHSLEDTYPYKDTTRMFQWEKIRNHLFFLDSIQQEPAVWATVQNYKNMNGEGPLVRKWHRNEYKLVTDEYGVSRYQSVPLYLVHAPDTAERYIRDGSLVKVLEQNDSTKFTRVSTVWFEGEWLVPAKYVKVLGDTAVFKHAAMVDRENQNIAVMEKSIPYGISAA